MQVFGARFAAGGSLALRGTRYHKWPVCKGAATSSIMPRFRRCTPEQTRIRRRNNKRKIPFLELAPVIRDTLKTGMIVAVLGFLVQGTDAFARGGGYGGWYAGYGNGTWTYAGFGGPGGWAPPVYGYTGNGFSSFPTRPYPQQANTSRTASDGMKLIVNVPADAKVFVNGRATTSVGAIRQYSSAGLRPGSKYDYRVRAEFTRDGKSVSEEKTVSVAAGQTVVLAFGASADPQVADVAASP